MMVWSTPSARFMLAPEDIDASGCARSTGPSRTLDARGKRIEMATHRTTLLRETSADTDILDLTADVRSFLDTTGVDNGWALLFVPGSTGALTTIEFERGAVADLKRAIDRLAPRDVEYDHDLRWGDGNGYSHVRAALIGPSLTVPVVEAALVLGTWQQIVLCDFDNRPRRRKIVLQIVSD